MAWNDVTSGAGTGAGIGGTIGSVVPGVGTALGTAAGGLVGGALGGWFGKQGNQETKIQETQRQLVDELLGSLRGNGPYSNLFTANEADFERSFAEPARARFRNYTTPQIQQGYINAGLQRGTGLEDSLARAGIDMDQLINQGYMDYVNRTQDRQSNAIGQILGQGPGAPREQSNWDAIRGGVSDYLGNSAFGTDFQNILDAFNNSGKKQTMSSPREGFERDPNYDLYSGRPIQ